jgi:uncharacterized membrane protein YfcA
VELIFDSVPQYLVACGAMVLSQTVYVLLGFGAGLIAVGIMAMVIPDVRDIVVMLLLLNLPAELWVVSRSWREVAWRGMAVILAGVFVGVPVGSWILKYGNPTFLLTLLGIVLVVVGSVFLVTPVGRRYRIPAWIAGPVGLVGGILTGLFGTGGPPLIFYFQLRGVDKTVFRGSLMTIFLSMTLVRVPSYAAVGLITAPTMWSALTVFPAVLLGAWLGNSIHVRISEQAFRRVVSAVLVALGILLLAR